MLPFAVKVKGLDDGMDRAHWVLAVDPKAGALVTHDDGSLKWHPLSECTFVKMVRPDQPMPVVPVQVKPQNGIALPGSPTPMQEFRKGLN